MTGPGSGKYQSVATQKPAETFTPRHHDVRNGQAAEHEPKLVGTDARILRTDLLHIPHKRPLQTHLPLNVCFRLAESLTAMAKQRAHGRDTKAADGDRLRCYWPQFFSYADVKHPSTRVIIRSQTSVSGRKKDWTFSNSLTRYQSCAFYSR